jgi:Flp pilus assembly protein TadD
LNSTGQAPAAIQVLELAYKEFPQDQDVLLGLITFNRDRGDLHAAKQWAQTLLQLTPNNPAARQLLESLSQPASAQ